MTIATNTIVKNGEDFIEKCLRQVEPHVDRMLIGLDNTSTDGTREILNRLEKEFDKIKVYEFSNKYAMDDLVKARNTLLYLTTEDYVWVLDDDEFYPQETIDLILHTIKTELNEAIALRFWFIIDKTHYHKFRSLRQTKRIFKNHVTLRWRGKFTKEAVFNGNTNLCRKNGDYKLLKEKYIHLSYLKKSSWRKDLKLQKDHKYPDIEGGVELPKNICDIIEKTNLINH